ncbi:membrane protein containing HD superfamily hydrolase domain, YQFF ortholog [Pseudanabaena sp. lw0831]|uniref:HD family phosphohydrolase n=1 Tax=Pseudanabaena sp. lw0831 TaxID=1357935 RepID=UPI001916A6D0|nr:HDIG domain-containing metalloprotein [Pseudanabaena sp. lw0831]GBO56357.1 membrane protein containing HD superfamily hydrolase domain, YQFF ortholog [Pseudanabaena sp. lw0831]
MGIAPNHSSLLPETTHRISRKWSGRAVIGITFVCLISTLSIRFYSEPRLGIGTFIDQDLRSPRTITATDIEATKQAKELAKQQVIPIYRSNPEIDANAVKHLDELLQVGDNLRISSGNLPYVDRKILNDDVQRYFRRISNLDWSELQDRANKLAANVNNQAAIASFINRDKEPPSVALAELTLYKIKALPADYQKLINTVTDVRKAYAMTQKRAAKGPEMFRDRLLEMTNEEWETCKNLTRQALIDVQSTGLVAGLPDDMLQKRLTNLSNLPTNEEHRSMSIALLIATAKPNMTIDYVGTTERAIKASESVQAQRISLKAGDLIVKGGEKITERQFVILDELKMTQRQVNLSGLILMVATTAICFGIFGYANQRWQYLLKVKLHIKDLWALGIICTGSVLATVTMAPNLIVFLPLASIGLIIGSFYSSRLALLVTSLTSSLLAIAISPDLLALAPIIIGAIVAAAITNRPLTRSHLAATGLLVGFLQASVYIAIALIAGSTPLVLIAITALQYASGGLISAIVALGAIPYLEHISYALTPFRLAELANLDRPLLRRLVTETPGTFQHTLFVANLAEAAARELGADTALVRTGTLYHDIGKTLRPEYFIENQMGQPNPHDLLNDPWESAKIVKEHVLGGIKLAQKYHLPEMLQAFIPEHQGTITISYFYCQAQKRSDHVVEEDFRYVGPIPQSRETGVVMLADACEAALRSLGTETTLEAAKKLLMRIFQARWDDGQLKDCSLSWEDLDRIAPVFIKVWQERNHGRIKYPHLADKLDPSGSALPDHLCKPKDSVTAQVQTAISKTIALK